MAIADLLPDRIRPRAVLDDEQLLGCADRQRLQDQAVENREQRGVGADAESKRQHRDEDDDRCRAERAIRVAPVDGPARRTEVAVSDQASHAVRRCRSRRLRRRSASRTWPWRRRPRSRTRAWSARDRVAHLVFEPGAEALRIGAQERRRRDDRRAMDGRRASCEPLSRAGAQRLSWPRREWSGAAARRRAPGGLASSAGSRRRGAGRPARACAGHLADKPDVNQL